MNSTDATADTADTAVNSHRKTATCENNLKKTVQLLSECVAATDAFFDGQNVATDTKVALLDLDDAIDSALLSLNADFVTLIEAQWHDSAAERTEQFASDELSSRELAASDAADDLDALMQIYGEPLESVYNARAQATRLGPLSSSVKLDNYRDFCRVVFGLRDLGAKGPTNEEAVSMIESALQEKQLAAEYEDDGLEVGESVVKPICLISSKLLEDPMKAKCGHYFSRAYIVDALQKNNGEIMCPSRGCNNFITRSQLVRDRMMDLKVLQYLRREDRAKQIESETVSRVA